MTRFVLVKVQTSIGVALLHQFCVIFDVHVHVLSLNNHVIRRLHVHRYLVHNSVLFYISYYYIIVLKILSNKTSIRSRIIPLLVLFCSNIIIHMTWIGKHARPMSWLPVIYQYMYCTVWTWKWISFKIF